MKRVIALIAPVALGVTIAACTGDTNAPVTSAANTSTSAAPLSKDAFIKQADSNCDDAYTSLANIDSSTSTSTTASSGSSSQTSEKKNTIDGLVEQLKGLQAPAGDQQGFNQFVSDLEKASKALDEQALAEKRSDSSASDSAASDFDSAMSDARSAAGKYGLKTCSKEGTASSSSSGSDSGTTTSPSSSTPSAPVTPAPAPATPAPAPAPAPSGGGTSGGSGGGISP
jgi:hypothetical protein